MNGFDGIFNDAENIYLEKGPQFENFRFARDLWFLY